MRSGIYVIVNWLDGKEYIGSTRALKSRWWEHRRNLRAGCHNNPHLQCAWQRDGEHAFVYSILEYCPIPELLKREQWWVEMLGTQRPERGYNICHPDRHTVSDETRAKIGAAVRGRKHSLEARARMSEAQKLWKRPPRSEEAKARQSEALRGRKQSPEHVANQRASRLAGAGYAHSEATRRKISEVQRGRKPSPEAIAKTAAALRGRPRPLGALGPAREARTRWWEVTSPEGEVLVIRNLSKFCRDHGLRRSLMTLVAQEKRKSHAGWKVRPAEPPS